MLIWLHVSIAFPRLSLRRSKPSVILLAFFSDMCTCVVLWESLSKQ